MRVPRSLTRKFAPCIRRVAGVATRFVTACTFCFHHSFSFVRSLRTCASALPSRVACAICDDTGWKTVDVDGVPRVERCDCWHQRLYDSLLKEARIPRRYAHCEFSNFDLHTDSQREAHKKAAALVDKFPVNSDRGLLFFGDHGVGKTHLAAALLKELIRRK